MADVTITYGRLDMADGIYDFRGKTQAAKAIKKGDVVSHKGFWWSVVSTEKENKVIVFKLVNEVEIEYKFALENEQVGVR